MAEVGEEEPLDREGRIQARRQRIAERNSESSEDVKRIEHEKEMESRSNQQIVETRAHIKALTTEGESEVTAVRIARDQQENERRISQEVSRQARRRKLLYEAEGSARQNAVVAMKWSSLVDKEVAQELKAEIEAQREACDGIIEVKDSLLAEFRLELKQRDEEYVKALKKQAEDVDDLLEQMGRQLASLRQMHEEEVDEVETSFMQERHERMQAHEAEVQALMSRRREREESYLEARKHRIEEDQRRLEAARVQAAEDYSVLKIKLETEIQTLEKQLEEMRATYQLNQEKLDYNYRVLVERDTENTTTIKHQKRKLTRMADVLSALRAKHAREEKRYKQENAELTEDYKRVTEQFKDLQAKFQHFEESDTRRYRDVWQMNEEIVTGLMRKVLQADKIIHEQQLGLHWFPPSEQLFVAGRGDGGSTHPASSADSAAVSSRGSVDNDGVQRMLGLLCDEAGFLVEQKVLKLLEPLPVEEQNLLKIDSILKVLGVQGAADLQKLLSFFVADAESGELIHPNDAMKAIKAFIEEHQRGTRDSLGQSSRSLASTQGAQGPRGEEREFWERMSSVISGKTYRVWGALERALQRYHTLLTSRSGVIDEVRDLQQQNDELKALLNQYLSSKINEDLHVPPTHTIRLDGSSFHGG